MLNQPPPFSNHPPNFSSSSNHDPYHDYASSTPINPGQELARSSQQFAYPIRGQMAYSGDTTPRPGTAFNLAENMLRRKTPGGTINGAYESNAHDTQAAKHMLMPRNDTPQAFGSYPQLDSVLQQAPYRQLHHPQFYGQTVPSVLQPPFQYLGPTASGVEGRGPYGPYWYDGTYVPYRPAALRDPRFYALHHSETRWGSNAGYGRMSSWQSDVPTPLAYPANSSRNANWPTITHGGPALPYLYATQGGAAFMQGMTEIIPI